jgi:hypothetical protein
MSDQRRIRARRCVAYALAISLVAAGRVVIAQVPQLSVQDRVAALSSLLADSELALRHYEWIETTIVTLHGEVRARKRERCYYAPDGTLKKDDVYSSDFPKAEPRETKRIAARPADVTEVVQDAPSLVSSYIPLSPINMQAARRAGRVSVVVLQPGRLARVNVLDYHKVGDEMGIEIDLAKNRILRVTVATYLDNITDVVTLNATMGELSDGTPYPATIMLEERTRSLYVTVRDTGYRIPDGTSMITRDAPRLDHGPMIRSPN